MIISSKVFTFPFGKPFLNPFGDQVGGLPASLVSRLEAVLTTSYPGTGDDWLDLNGTAAYDFFLGSDGTPSRAFTRTICARSMSLTASSAASVSTTAPRSRTFSPT